MKKLKIGYFILAATVILIAACAPKMVAPDDRIYIVNNSDKDVLWKTNIRYPDTTEFGTSPKHNSGTCTVPAKSKIIIYNGWIGVYSLFNPQTLPSGKLQVFIFDAQKLISTPDNMIQPNEFVLKRYVFTKDSIEKIGRIIVYP